MISAEVPERTEDRAQHCLKKNKEWTLAEQNSNWSQIRDSQLDALDWKPFSYL